MPYKYLLIAAAALAGCVAPQANGIHDPDVHVRVQTNGVRDFARIRQAATVPAEHYCMERGKKAEWVATTSDPGQSASSRFSFVCR